MSVLTTCDDSRNFFNLNSEAGREAAESIHGQRFVDLAIKFGCGIRRRDCTTFDYTRISPPGQVWSEYRRRLTAAAIEARELRMNALRGKRMV